MTCIVVSCDCQVLGSAILQQVFVVEFVVHHQMCDECHRRQAQDFWRAAVQIRQKVREWGREKFCLPLLLTPSLLLLPSPSLPPSLPPSPLPPSLPSPLPPSPPPSLPDLSQEDVPLPGAAHPEAPHAHSCSEGEGGSRRTRLLLHPAAGGEEDGGLPADCGALQVALLTSTLPPLTPHISYLTPHTSLLTPHPSHSLLTPHSSPLTLTPHSSLLTPHPSHSLLTPHPSPLTLTPHSSLLTPHTSYLTPCSSPLTPHLTPPHSLSLTPHSSYFTPHSLVLTPHSSLLTPHSPLLTPDRYKTSQELVSHDVHSNTYQYKHTFSVEIVPVCKVRGEG